jgi:hypothetical protein
MKKVPVPFSSGQDKSGREPGRAAGTQAGDASAKRNPAGDLELVITEPNAAYGRNQLV